MAVDATTLHEKSKGIFGGLSGGSNEAAALKLPQTERFRGSKIRALMCHSDLKYMSTDLWEL